MDTDTSEQWQKLLWRSQSFPDNYVPQGMFLSSLRRNLNFTPYDYKSLALLSCPITQHLAMTLVFLDVFIQLKDRSLDPRMLVLLTTTLFLVGYASWELILYFTSSDRRGNADRLKSSILIFLALMSLSPVLRTLTAATSSDSIWALSAALFLVSLLLADYGPSKTVGHSQESLTSVLSINAAISSSVVLASRLSDDLGDTEGCINTPSSLPYGGVVDRRSSALVAPFCSNCTPLCVYTCIGDPFGSDDIAVGPEI
ncbi:phosphatidylinositol n-acetylglucosaminyltransferase subunit c [Moniliophthora roreri]|nr:phosphatidylinositol n-acetylglucosaminyltransferase subunit c [Moniliophthora roreri]